MFGTSIHEQRVIRCWKNSLEDLERVGLEILLEGSVGEDSAIKRLISFQADSLAISQKKHQFLSMK